MNWYGYIHYLAFIRIVKRSTRVTILTMSVVFLAMCGISKHKIFLMVYCYQIRHATDSCDWKFKTSGFTGIFIFLLEFLLIRANIAVIIFKFIIMLKVHRSSKNLKIFENIPVFHRSCFFCFKQSLPLIIIMQK